MQIMMSTMMDPHANIDCRPRTRHGAFMLLTMVAILPVFIIHNSYILRTASADSRRRSTSSTQGNISIAALPSSPNISVHIVPGPWRRHQWNKYIRCYQDESLEGSKRTLTNRVGMYPELAAQLDYHVTVTSNLRLLFLGDSVSMQLSQTWDDAANTTDRVLLRESWRDRKRRGHENLHVGKMRGGGVTAGWRITSLLAASREGQALPNKPGGGWRRTDAKKLAKVSAILLGSQTREIHGALEMKHIDSGNKAVQNATAGMIGPNAWDVVIMRIPHGWIGVDVHNITDEALYEAIALARLELSSRHVIIQTLPLINNIITVAQYNQLQQLNRRIRQIAHNVTVHSRGEQSVLVLEVGRFLDGLTLWNARRLGMNTSTMDFLEESLKPARSLQPARKRAETIAQVCHDRVLPGSDSCRRNPFSLDGLHVCFETLGGRWHEGLACLLGCLFPSNDKRGANLTNLQIDAQERCQDECNTQFTTIDGVERPS